MCRSATSRMGARCASTKAGAETVRTLYALYRQHGTLRQVKAEADRLGLRTKQRLAADGTRTGGLPFRRGHLHCVLTNPLCNSSPCPTGAGWNVRDSEEKLRSGVVA